MIYASNKVTLDVENVPGGGLPLNISKSDLLAANSPPPLNRTPEPASLLLLGTGLAGVAGYLRRRNR